MKDLDPSVYTIAWIAPLPIEAQAAMHMLDARHEGGFPLTHGDDYVFRAGEMCGYNVVIAQLPREYGTGAAAALASQIKKFFPNLWFTLLVGVAAGLPSARRDIRLGDVIVAAPEGDTPGLVAYDLGKETTNGFQLLKAGHVLMPTESVVQSAIDSIANEYPDEARLFLPHYNRIKGILHRTGNFADPGQDQDTLYAYDAQTDTTSVVSRAPRPTEKRTCIWYGPIGSGERLVKNARVRDDLRDRYHLIGLEMEAAGTMNRVAAGVIRGVCDYGDEHKNKQWQPYAAAMAAAYAKAVLDRIRPLKRAGATVKEKEGGDDAVKPANGGGHGGNDESGASSGHGIYMYNKENKGQTGTVFSGGHNSFTFN
ncbi:tetratricopeptide repeat domain-containing protein [Beauveria brongniartii RCEF 3172]|uniref:Tetratricopeptide repeat domain-containing protein n=1 Tax=Beauveria brongniartii RCEF 3172 TaxID=1081107 RepID=A0A167L9G7_9HYPO|nr:tetratricopeptide repeat domain-containing protein [Beauveria brongniartii RCEF 3172]